MFGYHPRTFMRFRAVSRNFSNVYKKLTVLNVFKNKDVGERITVQGWVKTLRNMKDNIFIDVTDGSCEHKLQVVIPKSMKPQQLSTGASVIASGGLKLTPRGQIELSAEDVSVCGECVISDGYPFTPRQVYPPEYVRKFLHLRPRTNKFGALLRVRDVMTTAVHDYFHSEGFVNIHTPILTSNDCEGAGEVFTVQPENKKMLKSMLKPGVPGDEAYFDTKAYLTVSGQLHLEAAAHGLSKVYTFGPTFRAENSRSRLHLSEFYMVEAEIAFAEKLDQIIAHVEKLIKSVAKTVLNHCRADASICRDKAVGLTWIDKPFTIITYSEACLILEQNKGQYSGDFNKEEGLSKEHELFLVHYNGGVPIFVVNWPVRLKPFYMKNNAIDNTKVDAFDLLAPHVGELVGGSLRENSYERLKEKIPPGRTDLDWYLELRKFGSVPTGGFGMGFERLIQVVLGINSIKDTVPFPRWPHNCAM